MSAFVIKKKRSFGISNVSIHGFCTLDGLNKFNICFLKDGKDINKCKKIN